jgi:hypothetical protein
MSIPFILFLSCLIPTQANGRKCLAMGKYSQVSSLKKGKCLQINEYGVCQKNQKHKQ